MIPKKIHYCWFGGNPLPKKYEEYIATWRSQCPDYEIIRWDEQNFDIHCNAFVEKMYHDKKFAFVSDYARFWIIYNYGGFYLDTDIQLLKPLDGLRKHKFYMACEGLNNVNSGLGYGSEAGNDILLEHMKIYEKIGNGGDNIHPSPYYTTELLKRYGLVTPVKKVVELAGGYLPK
jgi:hypothetical protein